MLFDYYIFGYYILHIWSIVHLFENWHIMWLRTISHYRNYLKQHFDLIQNEICLFSYYTWRYYKCCNNVWLKLKFIISFYFYFISIFSHFSTGYCTKIIWYIIFIHNESNKSPLLIREKRWQNLILIGNLLGIFARNEGVSNYDIWFSGFFFLIVWKNRSYSLMLN